VTATSEHPHASFQPTYSIASEALEANLDLIERASRQFKLRDPDREDAYQEAAVAFLMHYPSFDPSRGVPLAAYMWPWVFGAVRHFVRDLAVDRDFVQYLDPIDLDKPDPVSVYDEVLDLDVARFLRTLPPEDRVLIVRRYWHDEAPVDIARSLGVSRQSIHVRQRRLLAQGQTIITAATAAA